MEAELFSLDGKERFHLKSTKEVDKADELGIEVGKFEGSIDGNRKYSGSPISL
mgnify:CR=1 FL=1